MERVWNVKALVFPKAPFLVLHFSYYTLMVLLVMLSVILPFMLMILLSILSEIRHLICDNLNWLLNLNLIKKILWTGARNSLFISMLGKLKWFRLTSLITLVLLMWKWMDLFLRRNHFLSCWSWPSLLNWTGALTLSLLTKLLRRKLGP